MINQIRVVFLTVGVLCAHTIQAAEWKTEPSIYLRTQYNDNVRMRTDINNPEGSSGFTIDPRIKFAGEEQQLWDVSIDARGKITRFQDIEDGDSDNIFFIFDGGKQTERSNWRLNTSYEDNSNFDTDFDTETPDAGLLDDQTQRKTASITPSVSWNMSEASKLSLSLNTTDVTYDKITSLSYQDYENSSAKLAMYWLPVQNHKIGFTANYSEYDSPEAKFSYEQTLLQVDYTYTINATSNLGMSFGGRKLDSLLEDGQLVGCENVGEFEALGQCLFSPPVFGDIESSDKGTVVSLSYKSKSERTSHHYKSGRTVQPSSFGAAQELQNVSYQFSIKNTERFTTGLILDVSKTETLSGINNSDLNDAKRYRFEPSINYRLNKNWNLNILYRYLSIDKTKINEESTSNAIFVNLFLHWPKLVTTY